MRFAPLLLALALAFPVAAVHGGTRIPEPALAKAEQLREQALASALGWKLTEKLTTEVGTRPPGTKDAASAVAWATAKLVKLGYAKVGHARGDFPKGGGPGTTGK